MNKPFDSIRKLALNKLDQFKFIMTIVMYLATVIPLLSLGYLMGRATPESSKWLLDLSSLLGSIGSLLGGLATVFAAWVAFGAYDAWKKQIIFQKDLEIMEELTDINNRIQYFFFSYFPELIGIFNQYKDDLKFMDEKEILRIKMVNNIKEKQVYYKEKELSERLSNIIRKISNLPIYSRKEKSVIQQYQSKFLQMQIIIQAITDPENVDRFTLRLIDRKIYDLDYKGSFHNDLDYQYKVIKNFYEERLGYNGAVL